MSTVDERNEVRAVARFMLKALEEIRVTALDVDADAAPRLDKAFDIATAAIEAARAAGITV